MRLTPPCVMQISLNMVILEEMPGKLQINEKEKGKPKRSSMHF